MSEADRKVWVPGHYRTINGVKKWVEGYYRHLPGRAHNK